MIRDSFAPEWLSVAQVASLSGYSTKTVLRAIWHKKLPATQRTDSGTWRIRIEDYDAWMSGRVQRAS